MRRSVVRMWRRWSDPAVWPGPGDVGLMLVVVGNWLAVSWMLALGGMSFPTALVLVAACFGVAACVGGSL